MIKRFQELTELARGSHPSQSPTAINDQQKRAEEVDVSFVSLVAGSYLRLWKPGDAISQRGRRLLIGVGLYSAYDIETLDLLSAAMIGGSTGTDRIDLFDVFTVLRVPPADFEPYYPGAKPFYDVPMVGLWVDGELQEIRQGVVGTEYIRNTYQLG